MNTPAAPPETWAKAKRAQTDDYALSSLRWCGSLDHLRGAVAAEADRPEPRQERIAAANQRIHRLKEIQS